MREIWAEIKEYPKYRVSTMGRVKSVIAGSPRHPPRMLKNYISVIGYAVVNLSEAGKSKQHYVHRLVAEAFLGPAPNGCQVAHWDGDRANPRLDNIRWATQSENEADKIRHGTNRHASKGSRTFTDSEVEDLCSAHYEGGVSMRILAAHHGVSHTTISHAIRNGSAA